MAQVELHLINDVLLRENNEHKIFEAGLFAGYLKNYEITHKILTEKVAHLYENAR